MEYFPGHRELCWTVEAPEVSEEGFPFSRTTMSQSVKLPLAKIGQTILITSQEENITCCHPKMSKMPLLLQNLIGIILKQDPNDNK